MLQTLRNAREMAKRSIAAREKVYKGIEEARLKFLTRPKTSSAISVDDEIQKWLSSTQAKTLIADNRWYIDQATMYATLSMAEDMASLLAAVEGLANSLEDRNGLQHTDAVQHKPPTQEGDPSKG
jgi:hypothetical protein